MKKRILKPKLKDMFSLTHQYSKVDSYFHYNIQNYNSLFGLVLFIFLSFILSLLDIKILVFPVTLSLYLGYEYIRLLIIVEKLKIERHIEKKYCLEGEKLQVMYMVSEPLSGVNCKISDDFDGSSFKSLKPPFNSKRIIHYFPLDCGFGEFSFNELKVVLSDHLQLFTFTLSFSKRELVRVEPYVQRIKDTEHIASFDSRSIGEYEFIKKGYSPTFYGLREYRFGDPLKHINWKASEKYKKTVVNEYENIQSLRTCMWLELESSDHMGNGLNSTWEYTRDLSLSLVKNNLEKNHNVRFLTNRFIIEENDADLFKNLKLRLSKERPEDERKSPFSFYQTLNQYEQGSDLILIQPFYISDNLVENINFLIKNSSYFGMKKLFLIDGFQAVKDLDPGEYLPRIQIEQKNAIDFLNNYKKQFALAKVEVFLVRVKRPHLLREQIERFI